MAGLVHVIDHMHEPSPCILSIKRAALLMQGRQRIAQTALRAARSQVCVCPVRTDGRTDGRTVVRARISRSGRDFGRAPEEMSPIFLSLSRPKLYPFVPLK